MPEPKPEYSKADDVRSETQKLLAMSEISLQLDTYNDIFSSFDPHPYTERALSIDFLEEAKRASRDKGDSVELRLLIPNSVRSLGKEALIKKRLREHFRKHFYQSKKEMKSVVRQGLLFVFFGLILMFSASYLLFKGYHTLLADFIIVILEPGGWFLFWEGLDMMVFEAKKKRPDAEFYRKMAECRITFLSY